MNLTKEELAQVEYNDLAITQMKTKKQKEDKEKDEYKTRMIKRSKLIKQAEERVKNEPRLIFINGLRAFVEEKDITPTMRDMEVEMWFNWLI